VSMERKNPTYFIAADNVCTSSSLGGISGLAPVTSSQL
jgi:hypothetical protein